MWDVPVQQKSDGANAESLQMKLEMSQFIHSLNAV